MCRCTTIKKELIISIAMNQEIIWEKDSVGKAAIDQRKKRRGVVPMLSKTIATFGLIPDHSLQVSYHLSLWDQIIKID